MNFVIIGLLVVLFIAFLVVVWKAATNWRWYNIVGSIFLMILSIIFLFPTAAALSLRNHWHKLKVDAEKELESVQQENGILRDGDPNDPTVGTGLNELRTALKKASLEAGRHWFGLAMSGQDPQNVRLAVTQPAADAGIPGAPAPADAAAPAANAPTTPLIEKDMIVYGFAEAPVQGVDQPVPVFYLGEFVVTSSTPTSVNMKPTAPLEQTQIDRIRNGQATRWSVYELLPLDAHDTYVAEGSSPDKDNLFGRMDENMVNGILSSTEILPETRQAYLDDGMAKPDVQPDNRWVEVEFLKSKNIDVDSPDQRAALDGPFFDGSGRSVDSRLKRSDGVNVAMKKGDQIVMWHEEATKLQDEGVVEIKGSYYVRRLNDYRQLLRKQRLTLITLDIRRQELEYDQGVLEAAIAATDSMMVSEQKDKGELEEDRDQIRIERTSIQKYATALKTKLTSVKKQMADFYQQNVQLEKMLKQAHATN